MATKLAPAAGERRPPVAQLWLHANLVTREELVNGLDDAVFEAGGVDLDGGAKANSEGGKRLLYPNPLGADLKRGERMK